MSENEKKGPTPEEQKELEVLLAEIGGGRKIIIDRKTPSWCDGHVQTIEVAADDSISLEDIEREIGGHKFEFKIYDTDKSRIVARRTVKFSGSPPRKYGRVVKRDDYEDEDKKPAKKEDDKVLQLFLETQKQMNQIQADNQKNLADMQTKHNEQLKEMYMERLKAANGQRSDGQDQFQSVVSLMEFGETLRERFGGSSESMNPLHKQMLDMAETFFEFKLGQEKAKFEHQMNQQTASAPRPLPERTAPAKELGDLEDQEVLKEAAKRFKDLNTLQQKKAFEMFFAEITENTEDEQKDSITENENDIESDDKESENENSEYTDSELDLDSEDEQELDGDRGQAQALQETKDPASA